MLAGIQIHAACNAICSALRASGVGRIMALACLVFLAIGTSHQFSPRAESAHGGVQGLATQLFASSASIDNRPSDHSSQSPANQARTREILAEFYHATGGDQWHENRNWLSNRPIHTWHGVSATKTGLVEELIIRENNLDGAIPATLGELGSIRKIDLGSNHLTGAIPPELSRLTRMYHLHLGSNQLIGTIPPELGGIPALQSLDLYENNLVGHIPAELGSAPRLFLLRLDGNQLSGPIPAALGQLGRLAHLRLNGNLLTGSIPPELGNLVRLTRLQLDHNLLTGSIPPELGNLVRLESLRLDDNNLSGSVPAELGGLAKLRDLFLSENNLSGELPPELANIQRMRQFAVYNNDLSGPIPPQLHVWNDPLLVWIRGNRLSGCIPGRWNQARYQDFGWTDLPYCEFGLPHLGARPGLLDPAYDPKARKFSLLVGIDVEEITLRPFSGPAAIAIKDGSGRLAVDADSALAGYQIRLPPNQQANRYTIEYSEAGESAVYEINVIRRFPGRIRVLDNFFVEAEGNDDLKHNIPDLTVEFGNETLTADFLSHFHRTGGLERWGYPTSEVLILEPNSLTQFYQRGVVDFHDVGAGWLVERRLAWDYIGGGLGGSPDLGAEPDLTNPHPGTLLGPWRHRISNYAVDGTWVGFANFFARLGGTEAFGFPKTDARVDGLAETMIGDPTLTPGFIRQYFQAGVIEFHPGDEREPVKLSLLGDTLRDRLVPGHDQLAGFARAQNVAIGSEFVPLIAAPNGDPVPVPANPGSTSEFDEQISAEAELGALVDGNTAFAIDLYRHLGESRAGQNLVFSPYSISQAFAMTTAGANGETATQLRGALKHSLRQDRLHPTFQALDSVLAGGRYPEAGPQEGELELNIANSLWVQSGFELKMSFLDALAEHYGAAPIPVDFILGHENARLVINRWVEDQTQERIKDLLSQGTLDRFTRLVLVNAIYFKAGWAYPFTDGATQPLPFHLLDGSVAEADLMNVAAPFPYMNGNGFVAVELPYLHRGQHMLLLVPDRARFADVERSLSVELIGQIDEGLNRTSLNLWLPKFEFDTDLSLAKTIKDMGAPDAFDRRRAEFANINGRSCLREDDDCLYIKDAIHKAFIAVDEDGTEAAAATAVIFATPESTVRPPPPLLVRIDRPFMIFIRDDATGSMLFAGRVLDPRH